MNTRAHAAVTAFRPEFTACVKFAEEELLKNTERWAAWIECASAEAKAAQGLKTHISNQDLVRMMFAKRSTMLDRALACEELSRRFLDEHNEEILESARVEVGRYS